MFRSLLLAAACLIGIAGPALAQTSAPATRPGTIAPPPAASSPTTSPSGMARPAVVPPSGTPVPTPRTTTTPAATPTAGTHRIDVNGASESELASLPGIGPVTAHAIVAGRPWDDLADLTKKKVVNGPTFERNKDRFALADINKSSVADMAKTLPGIGDARARKIADGRPYATPTDLVGKKVLTQSQYDKIKDVITY